MNKQALYSAIGQALDERLKAAESAALQAYETATHEENVAENKYDTLGLEAAYLAEGQSRRVAEFRADCQAFSRFPFRTFNDQDELASGALLCLSCPGEKDFWYFLSPIAGGLALSLDGVDIVVLGLDAPLGKRLLGLQVGDALTIPIKGEQRAVTITGLY